MAVQSIDLAWIVVNDLKQSVKYYTEILGMKLSVFEEQMGWAELKGAKGGAILGLVQANQEVKAGNNAVVTFTVENLDKTVKELSKKGLKCVGEKQVVPDQVELQMILDNSGNQIQLVQNLSKH